MDKRRTDWIDCIAGVLIIRMILGHYISYAGLKTSPMFSALDLYSSICLGSSINQVCSIVLWEI